MSDMIHALKARYVFPVSETPIAGGVIAFDEEQILSVGHESDAAGEAVDLGNAAIIPGMVNAHTHLEFSHLNKPVGRPGISLGEWIATLTTALRCNENRQADAARQGIAESSAAGVTALGEIAQPDWAADVFQAATLDATVFLELIAPTDDAVDEKLKSAHRHIASADRTSNVADRAGWRPGLSPHAPYSIHPRLLAEVAAISARHQVPLAFHLAESPEELKFLETASGPFRKLLEGLNKWEPQAHRRGRRPLDFLRLMAPAHRSLVIHGNYLCDEEIAFISQNAKKMSVVYCPRTHRYFKHAAYPLKKLLDAGINVALGTDSRASSPDLNLLSDMRHVAHSYPDIEPAVVLRMGTIAGARALGMENESGTLEAGKTANLTVIPLPNRKTSDPHNLIFDQNAPACGVWFRGRNIQL